MCTEQQRKFARTPIISLTTEAIRGGNKEKKSCPNRYNTIKEVCERLESNNPESMEFSELSFD